MKNETAKRSIFSRSIACILAVLMLIGMLSACSAPAKKEEPAPAAAAEPAAKAEETKEESPAEEAPATVDIVPAIIVQDTFGFASFTDFVLAGAQKACDELGIELTVLEQVDVGSIENTLKSLAASGYNLFILPTQTYVDVVKKVAPTMPEVKFAVYDTAVEGFDNVYSVQFRENESTFLAGATAALTSETGKIGFVGAQPNTTLKRFESGFYAGAKTVNPDIEISSVWTNSFSDVSLGKEAAALMYNEGVDIIFACAGAGSIGVFQQVSEEPDGKWAIGAGSDGQFSQSPEKIIASPVKVADTMAYEMVMSLSKGEFQGQTVQSSGLKETGVNFIYNDNAAVSSVISDDTKALIETLKNDIMSGKITPPNSEEALAAFEFPTDYVK